MNVMAFGLSISKLIENIFSNESEYIHTLCSFSRDFFGVKQNVFLSLPCKVNRKGIKGWIPLTLTKEEEELFRTHANNVLSLQNKLLIYRK